MLAARYPSVSLALVHKVLAYYLENQAQVDAYVAKCMAAVSEQQKGGRALNLSSLRSRLAEAQRTVPEARVG